MDKLPTKKQAKKIHQKLAKGPHKEMLFENVWTHSKIVSEIALQLAKRLEEKYPLQVDKDFIRAAALLHDVGIYRYKFDPINPGGEDIEYYKHGLLGKEILEELGFSEKFTRICEVHLGVGITKEEINQQGLDLETKDIIPITAEEELIMYADKFHAKKPCFVSFEEARDKLRPFGWRQVDVMTFYKTKYGLPDLEALKEKYENINRKIRNYKDKVR